MEFSIEKFSTYLCLVYSTDLCGQDPEFKISDQDPLIVFILMMKLREMYKQEILSAIDRIFHNDDTYFFRSFFRAILSRCVELSKSGTYLTFMLASTFVKQVVTANYCSTKCYMLPKIASLALIAAYNRCYRGVFITDDKSNTLESYCNVLNDILAQDKSVEERRNLSYFVKQDINFLMVNFSDVDDTNFELTYDEEKMLNDIFLDTCSLDLIDDAFKTASRPSESNVFMDESDSQQMEYSITNDNPHRKNLCKYCGIECSKFVFEYCSSSSSPMETNIEI